MTEPEFQGAVLRHLSDISTTTDKMELRLARMEAQLYHHEQRDEERFSGIKSDIRQLRSADDTSRNEALNEARAQLAIKDNRKFDLIKGAGLALLAAVLSLAGWVVGRLIK